MKSLVMAADGKIFLASEEGKIVVKPVKKRKLSLAQMLKGITKENRHAEIDWGGPVGREIW